MSVRYAHDGPYAFGKDITLADALLVPQMYNARRFKVPLNEYPRLVAVADACNEVQAFQDAAPENQPDFL
jgi:maleylpyruvate isomerase